MLEKNPDSIRRPTQELFAFARSRELSARARRALIRIANRLLDNGKITKCERAVFEAALAIHQRYQGRCHPSYETLATAANCSRRTVASAINKLAALGLMFRQQTRRWLAARGKKIFAHAANQYAFPEVSEPQIEAKQEAASTASDMFRAAAKAACNTRRRVHDALIERLRVDPFKKSEETVSRLLGSLDRLRLMRS